MTSTSSSNDNKNTTNNIYDSNEKNRGFDEQQDVASWIGGAIGSATVSAAIVLYAGQEWLHLSYGWLTLTLSLALYVIWLLVPFYKKAYQTKRLGVFFATIAVLVLISITIWTIVTISGEHPVRQF